MLRTQNKKRMQVIFIGALCLFVAIAFKLGYEQLIDHKRISDKAKDLWQRDFKLAGNRGAILSNDGEVLAMDVPSTSVIVIPSLIEDAQAVAGFLSEVLQCDEAMPA